MKLMTYLLTVLGGLFVTGMATPIPTDYQECGNAWYDPASYVCSNDTNTLCPIINGEPMQDCAGACYTPLKYNCDKDILEEKPKKAMGMFTLTATGGQFDCMPIQAAGLHFWVGGHAATYCPTVAGDICGTFPNDTTVLSGGGMATVVPGGQNLYWQQDGALAFTQAHSASQYNLSYYGGGVAYQDGGYFGPNGEDLITCPVYDTGSDSPAWKLFARLAGIEFSSECRGLYVSVHDSNYTAGAWQYT